MSKPATIDSITNYIEKNYLTLDELSNQTNIHHNQLQALIDNGCLPKHSHVITKQIVFHTEIFGDEVFNEQIFYYHPSLIPWAIKAHKYLADENLIAVANKIKADFIDELQQALLSLKNAKPILKYCCDMNGNILTKEVNEIISEHWPYIMDGTYGVCLKEISAQNILLKNIAVAVLEEWVNSNNDKNKLYEKAQYAAELYNSVAADFGPHEIFKSTRARLVDKFKEHLV